MRVFVAGASGVIGRSLTDGLAAARHEVAAMTRSDGRAADLQRRGATPVICDVFDRDALRRALEKARPDVVIHQLTALPRRIDPRRIRIQLAETNRLRAEGTKNLFEAALGAGATRFIAQSIAFAYDPSGEGLKTEDDQLMRDPPGSFAEAMAAVRSLEETTLGNAELPGVVLRYGFFYGPDTAYSADGPTAADVRKGRFPIVGEGAGVFSFIHVEDAASATVAAIERWRPGVYNIVDDEPAAVRDWLPAYAEALGARTPGRVPRWLARLFVGPYATYLLCDQRGASNAKAKREFAWAPKHPTWRPGFGLSK